MAKRRQEDEAEVLARANLQAEARIQAETGEPSLYEQMWRLLDQRMDWMMKDVTPTYEMGPVPFQYWCETRGQAKGIAECLALLGKPLVSDVDDVRAMAMERWEARQRQPAQKRKRARRA